MYDVSDDRLRTRIATICEDYGLQRIQYSTFMGPMTRNRQEEAFQKITRRVGGQEANVQLFTVCDKDLATRKQLIVRKEVKRHPREEDGDAAPGGSRATLTGGAAHRESTASRTTPAALKRMDDEDGREPA